MIGTLQGQAIRFAMEKFRVTGRGTRGVRGISLEEGDRVIGMIVVEQGINVLTITEKGYGKRSDPVEYRITDRGGKGVRNFKVGDKVGLAVCLASVRDDQEILVITRLGNVIRLEVSAISLIGRDTQGVRVIRIDDDDTVTGVAVVEKEDVDPSKLESAEEARVQSAAEAGPAPEDASGQTEAAADADENPSPE
jgi:DNA gyrase subunit A